MIDTLVRSGDYALQTGLAFPQWLPAPASMAPEGANASLARLLAAYQPITLAQIDRVALLNRDEAKYVMTTRSALSALGQLSDSYSVLVVEGLRVHDYRTLYFDTSDFALYLRHHAGALNRYKVRAREYVTSRSAFLEVKLKTNKRRVVKQRVPTAGLVTELDQSAVEWLDGILPYDAGELQPRLWNTYSRITLVNRFCKERVTLDMDLEFSWQGTRVSLPGIAIAEVKQEGHVRSSEFARAMHASHVQPGGLSKYCMGISLLYPEVKHNRFKAKQRLLAKLMGGY